MLQQSCQIVQVCRSMLQLQWLDVDFFLYIKSMHRYALSANYIQWKENDHSKIFAMYIDGRPKEIGNISSFINSTWPSSTSKQPNCIFEVHEGNEVFVCAIKSISAGEELLIDYHLNHIDTNKVTIMRVVSTIYHFVNKFFFVVYCFQLAEFFMFNLCDRMIWIRQMIEATRMLLPPLLQRG